MDNKIKAEMPVENLHYTCMAIFLTRVLSRLYILTEPREHIQYTSLYKPRITTATSS